MRIRITTVLILALAMPAALVEPARADLQLCSRMSYVVEVAIAMEDKGAATTRGWFRVDPGQCRTVIQGALPDTLYIHAQALAVYGGSPLPQAGQTDFCVGDNSFVLPASKHCNRGGQRLARFTAVKPTENDKGVTTAYLAEDAEYDNEQARDAGIQRLLAIAGYDGGTIDGVRGAKTDAAIAQFIVDNKLGNTAAGRSDFFDMLIAAAQRPNGAGFAWCNETRNTVMAALGVEDKGSVVTRGWYRVAPGKCLRPDLTGQPQRLYSFGEAVGTDGLPVKDASRPTIWGGATMLCTRNVKFELADHKDCAAEGLTATGFATVEWAASGGTTVQFK